MVRRTIKNASIIQKKAVQEAKQIFIQHCRIKNLSPRTLKYYEEDLEYFFSHVQVKYVEQITLEVYEEFLSNELEAGKKITSLNSRIRGLRVFFKFCAEREYMEPLTVKLMKEDETIKEPYTDAELERLLKKPRSNSWAEWSTWAAINYLVATGDRASTVINIKVKDIDFEDMTIFLSRVKNRRQQIIPLSKALKEVLKAYLETWDYSSEDYLFSANTGGQLNIRSFQGAVSRYNISRGNTKAPSFFPFKYFSATSILLIFPAFKTKKAPSKRKALLAL